MLNNVRNSYDNTTYIKSIEFLKSSLVWEIPPSPQKQTYIGVASFETCMHAVCLWWWWLSCIQGFVRASRHNSPMVGERSCMSHLQRTGSLYLQPRVPNCSSSRLQWTGPAIAEKEHERQWLFQAPLLYCPSKCSLTNSSHGRTLKDLLHTQKSHISDIYNNLIIDNISQF